VLPDVETTYSAWCELVHQKMARAALEIPDEWRAVCAAGKANLGPGKSFGGTIRPRNKVAIAKVVHAATRIIERRLSVGAAGVAFVDLWTAGRPRDIGLEHTVGQMNLQARYHLKESIPLELDFDECLRRFCAAEALDPVQRQIMNSRAIKINAFAVPADDLKLFNDSQVFQVQAHESFRRESREPETGPFAGWVELHLTGSVLQWRLQSHLPQLSDVAAELFADIEAEL
jgi:hypothetical protein